MANKGIFTKFKKVGYIRKVKIVFFDTIMCFSRSRGKVRFSFPNSKVRVKMQSERKWG
jgi:hypothetical protein